MSKKKKSDAVPASATPFFARYLEGQDGAASASAKVGNRKSLAYMAGRQTLKYPSDRDEWELYPYYLSIDEVPKDKAEKKMTLKYPSDSDEERYDVFYPSLAEVKETTAKPGATADVRLKKKK